MLDRGGRSCFYHRDSLGSIRTLTDAAGVIINEYDYDAYGNLETRIETVPNPFTFPAREFDPKSNFATIEPVTMTLTRDGSSVKILSDLKEKT